MGRILAIDYGIKNCGIAVTDPLQIIANPLKTVKTSSLLAYLEGYWKEEDVDKIVFGYPTHMDGNPTYVVKDIKECAKKIGNLNSEILIDYQNENFSSKEAEAIILKSGLSKKQRQDKSRLDKISAVIILQRYLKHI